MRQEKTFLRENFYSLWHRKIGSKMYLTDIDVCFPYSNSIHGQFTYENGYEKIKAFFDIKKGDVLDAQGKMQSYQTIKLDPALKAQRDVATVYGVPLFVVITYSDSHLIQEENRFPVPMFYLIPIEQMSLGILNGEKGKWFNEEEMIKLEYGLRNITLTKEIRQEIEDNLGRPISTTNIYYPLPKILL